MQVIPVWTQANELSAGETTDPLKARAASIWNPMGGGEVSVYFFIFPLNKL